MKKNNLLISIYLFFMFVFIASTVRAEKTTMLFFWGDGCPHCASEKPFLQELEQKYPDLKIKYYEVWYNTENANLFQETMNSIGKKAEGVPTTILGDDVWVGFADYMKPEMEKAIQKCIELGCQSPIDNQKEINNLNTVSEELCVHLFVIGDCPQCSSIIPYLESLIQKHDVELKIHDISNADEKELYDQFKEVYSISNGGYPIVFIGDKYLVGETAIRNNLDTEINNCKETGCVCPATKIIGLIPYPPKPEDITPEKSSIVNLPILGKIDTANMSLPLFTIMLAGLDSFNPCAFFVLFFLLTMLIYAKDRKRMLLIGITFVFFSAFIYFLFMAAWLNLFLLIGQLMIITTIAGIIALIIAVINIKDFFFFEKGFSLVIPESAKPKLFERMRNLLKASSLPSMMFGTIVLAIAANSYELLCTAGFPMVFTRILTLNGISTSQYYLYLALYNFVYVIPLLVIVLMFVITLGAKKLTEWQGQVLKLISGMMMLCLGLVLLIKPALLNNLFVSFGLMATALTTAGIIIFITKKIKKN